MKMLSSQSLTREGRKGIYLRIQMRLSQEARVIISEQKLKSLRTGISKTSGEVVDDIFAMVKDKSNISWKYIRESPEYKEVLANYKMVNPTTLNLSDQTINDIENLREVFNKDKDLAVKRTVYRSFIIRMVLKAYKMKTLKAQKKQP